MPNTLVGLLNATPFFATRPFLTTFLISLVVRFTDILDGPSWFVSDLALSIMALLALIEIFGAKTDLGRFLDEFTPLAKGVLNLILVLILVMPVGAEGSAGGRSSLGGAQIISPFTNWGLTLLWPIVSGASVWILAWLRSSLLSTLIDLDEDDDLGVQGYFSWIEDFWTISGTLVALFFPLLALSIYILTLIGLFLIHRYVVYVQEKRKIECRACQESMLLTALYCPNCREPNMEPRAVGTLGQALERHPIDPHQHQHDLISRKRCPMCATRLSEHAIQQACAACGTITFEDILAVERYLARLRRMLPRTLVICLGMSFIPIFGILPGVIYYRLAFISSMRGYVRRRAVFFIRWGLIVFNLILISVQWIPFVGALSIPIMCLTNYWVYQRMFLRTARRDLDPTEPARSQGVRLAI